MKGRTERVSAEARIAVKTILLRVEAWELVTQQNARPPSWASILDTILALANVLPAPVHPLEQARFAYVKELLSTPSGASLATPPARGMTSGEAPAKKPPQAAPMAPEAQIIGRSLHRLVYEDRSLSLDQARHYCDLLGIPRSAVEP
jgi:hypothetical protein